MDTPLSYFQNLLQYNKINELKNKLINDFLETHGPFVISVDKDNGIVEYWGSFSDSNTNEPIDAVAKYSFKGEFNHTLNNEYLKAKKKIDDDIVEITKNDKSHASFVNLHVSTIKNLKEKASSIYPETPEIKNYLEILEQYIISNYRNKSLDKNKYQFTDKSDYSELTFLWDALDDDLRDKHLRKMYKLLLDKKVIEGSETDFINALSHKQVSDSGIKWLIKGPNKHTSKSSLWYFIHELNSNYITEVNEKDLNKKVKYIFRDHRGYKFKDVKQAKYNDPKKPTGKDIIDLILQEVVKD